jgi:hypothetical protein
MAIYSERMPIPNEMDLTMVPIEGQPGVFHGIEGASRGKDGLIRTVHSALHFDLEMAKSVRDWLNEKIDVLEKLQDGRL